MLRSFVSFAAVVSLKGGRMTIKCIYSVQCPLDFLEAVHAGSMGTPNFRSATMQCKPCELSSVIEKQFNSLVH